MYDVKHFLIRKVKMKKLGESYPLEEDMLLYEQMVKSLALLLNERIEITLPSSLMLSNDLFLNVCAFFLHNLIF